MAIRVEFFGMARRVAGLAEVAVEPAESAASLRQVLEQVEAAVPAARGHLIVGGGLSPSLTANVEGRHFTRDLQARVSDGQTLLLLSADAGG